MHTTARRNLLIVAALSLLVSALPAHAQGDRDVPAMIAGLKFPQIGEFRLEFKFQASSFKPLPTGEAAAAEIVELQPQADAGQATPAQCLRLSRLYVATGNAARGHQALAQAVQLYTAEVQAKPTAAVALTGLGDALEATHRDAEAEQAYTRAIAADPNYLVAYSGVVSALAVQANSLTSRYHTLLIQHADELATLRDAGLDLSQPDITAAQLETVRQRAPGFAAAWDTVWNQPPTEAQMQACRAAADRAARWVSQARPLYRARLQAAATPELFFAYVQMEIDGAIAQILGQAPVAQQPKSTNSQALMGRAIMDLIAMAETRQISQDLCVAYPGDARICGFVGMMQMLGIITGVIRWADAPGEPAAVTPAEQMVQTRANLEAGLALPVAERPRMLGALGLLLSLMGDGPAAVKLAEDAIARGEWDYGAVSMALLGMLGITLTDIAAGKEVSFAEKPAVADTLARWLQQINPDEPAPWASLASMYAQADAWDKALPAMQRACELLPQSLAYATAYGIILLKLDHAAEAVTVLQAATALPSDDQELQFAIHYATGVALLATGQTAAAEVELDWKP